MYQITLFCLPHAGGSSAFYGKWKQYFNDKIQIYPIELKGRGRRNREELYSSFEEAVEDIYSEMQPLLIKPFAILGHSMGGLLAYEVSCKIKQLNAIDPLHLFISGKGAPNCLSTTRKSMHQLPDIEFSNEVRKLGGTPEEVFRNEMLFNYFIPLLKADYKIFEEYQYYNRSIELDCGITVLNGQEDRISNSELLAWEQLTRGKCSILNFSGGHFFINNHVPSIVNLINQILC